VGRKEVLDVYGKDVPFFMPCVFTKGILQGWGWGRGIELNYHL